MLVYLPLFLLPAACTRDTSAPPHSTQLPQLTEEQRVADVAYFFALIRESYPFLEAMAAEKGLGTFLDREALFIERTKNTKSRREFMALFMEMMQYLEQGTGHADVAQPFTWVHDRELDDETAKYGISLAAFSGQREWWRLVNMIRRPVFSDAPVVYSEGKYVTREAFATAGVRIPKGAAVSTIDGVPVDQYVRSCQDRAWLRFDTNLRKPYHSAGTPFLAYWGSSEEPWAVQFLVGDGEVVKCELPKLTDVTRAPARPVPPDGLICLQLSDAVGYINVPSFPGRSSARREEHHEIRRFLTGAGNAYKKLIIDVRRNSGGSPVYWEEGLIPFFIDEPVDYVQYAAVKRAIFDRLEGPFRATRPAMRSVFDPGEFRKVKRNQLPWKGLPAHFSDSEWYFFEVRRTYSAAKRATLDCEVFVLTDNDCFSATEDFVRAIKQLRLATLVGASTAGGAAAFMEPWLFELPNSHIIFLLEIELAFNPDGRINEIYGTSPDFELEPSRYPTTYPTGFSKEELLQDAWIQWAIRRK